MRTKQFIDIVLVTAALLALSVGVTQAQAPLGTAFTYQGRLTDGANPANGNYDLQFKLMSALTGGSLVGGTLVKDNVSVASGLFTVSLDFGAVFNGQARYLEIGVRPGTSTGAFTLLTPRQVLSPVPNALFSSAPWATSGSNLYYVTGNVGIGTSAPGRSLHILTPNSGVRMQSTSPAVWTTLEYHTNARIWHAGVGGSTVSNDVKSKYYIFDGTAAQFRMTIDTAGNVGIGTTAPNALLSLVKAGAPQPTVQNVPTGLKVGTPAGTMPLALKQNAAESTGPGLAYFETANGDLGSIGANSGALILGAAANKALGFNVNGASRAMTIASNGAIGIGTTNMGSNRVQISSPGTTSSSFGLSVFNGTGTSTFSVRDDGRVYIGHLGTGTSAKHVCASLPTGGYLENCTSAAEYVPTIDGGAGFPDTADLVSIVPTLKNPYGDTHGPFAVQKSATACDPNLLGYIVDPKSGANGLKPNDHYLPLAIYGYFPAKVTLENGAIKRGDPLTSSSKPGYAMKATDACKIIGYALEDAMAEGRIQVFADLSENAAVEVQNLRKEVDAQLAKLNRELATAKQQNAALEARLQKLEQVAANDVGIPGFNMNWLVPGGALLLGIVVVRRGRKDAPK